uniref:Uncharacterized protein n=1 Tax=Amblyomma tuberculatum TaxID=48802 RepID=A0A6M2E1W9_9ACAR
MLDMWLTGGAVFSWVLSEIASLLGTLEMSFSWILFWLLFAAAYVRVKLCAININCRANNPYPGHTFLHIPAFTHRTANDMRFTFSCKQPHMHNQHLHAPLISNHRLE